MLSLNRPSVWAAAALTASLLYLVTYVVSAKAETSARILNLDQRAYKVIIEEGDNTRKFSVAPNQELKNICASKCYLSIDSDPEPYEIAALDRLIIEQGQLFYRDNEDNLVNQKEESEDEPEPAPKPGDDDPQ